MATTLNRLAREALFAVSDLLDDEALERFEALSPAEKIRWRYCHADCDDFALVLSEIMERPVVSLCSPSKGPVHRLVLAANGMLLDASGYVSIPELAKRYGVRRVIVDQKRRFFSPTIGSDIHDEETDRTARRDVYQAILNLPGQPFEDEAFRSLVTSHALKNGIRLRASIPSAPGSGSLVR